MRASVGRALWALVLMQSGDKRPITSALQSLQGVYFTDNNLIAAGSMIVAVPTLVAAGAYDLYKHRAAFSADDLEMLAVGLVAAFVAAFVCVRWLIRYVATHDFRWFAWYRIAFGLVVLATAYFGWVNWTAA